MNDASSIERLEKHMAKRITTAKTPIMSMGSSLMFTPKAKAKANIMIAWKTPLRLADSDFPKTID